MARNQWKRHSQYLAIFVITLVLCRIININGLADPIDYIFSDLWHQLAGIRYQPTHVALVEIDEESLNHYKDDPLIFWTPQVAKASEVLRKAGALVIGLDLMFSISPEKWLRKNQGDPSSTFDLPIRREIANGQLILVASTRSTSDGLDEFLLPAVEHLLSIPDFNLTSHIGIADFVADKDSVVRQFNVAPRLNLSNEVSLGNPPRLSFAPLLAIRAQDVQDLMSTHWIINGRQLNNDSDHHTISFAGPPGTIPRISLKTLLEIDALESPEIKALKGKVVIIGGNYLGMSDVHATPYSSSFFGKSGAYMTGPEVQASIVETILSANEPRQLTQTELTFYQSLFLILGLILFRRLQPIPSAISFFTLFVIAAVLAYVAFLNELLISVAGLYSGLTILFFSVLGIKYATEYKERNYITQIFGRYVSSEVVDEIVMTGEMPTLGGVTQEITVLFSDIRNFTSISEKLNAEEVVEMLNTYFEKICGIVLREGGTIDKFIGDAIMVQFGAPIQYQDHSDRALRSALAMQQYAMEFKDWLKRRFPNTGIPEFAIGIGLHSGPAVIGNIGSTSRLEYTAIGDTVNMASRIEGKTKELRCPILASKETILKARSNVTTGLSKSVFVKGKEIPIQLHEILKIDSGTNP